MAFRPACGRRRLHRGPAPLFGDPGRPPTGGYALQSLAPACISREFSAFALKRTSPITMWLRELAAAEHERCGGPGVGAVGMCFTGGFALAMMVDDVLLAPVLSQPSQPFPIGKRHKADVGISDADLARVKERTEAGQCLLGLRFTNDPFCFEQRFESLRRELGDKFIAVEIDSAPGNPYGHPKSAHSVLTHHLVDEPGTPTRAALDQTLAFFRELLGVGRTGPRPGRGLERTEAGRRRTQAGARQDLGADPLSERTAPSMAPQTVAVSVPAQCSRPTGSRRRRPYWVSTPVGKWAMEQPRVQRSSAQLTSSTWRGAAARARSAWRACARTPSGAPPRPGPTGPGPWPGGVGGDDPVGVAGLRGVEGDLYGVVGGHGGSADAVVAPEGRVVDRHRLHLGSRRHLVQEQRVVRRERGLEADGGGQRPGQGQHGAP